MGNKVFIDLEEYLDLRDMKKQVDGLKRSARVEGDWFVPGPKEIVIDEKILTKFINDLCCVSDYKLRITK